MRCVPDMSAEFLRKELDFYQLPVEPALEVAKSNDAMRNREVSDLGTCKGVSFEKIMNEIKRCGFEHFSPLDVFVYYQFKDKARKEESRQTIYVRPSRILFGHCGIPKEHAEFCNALVGERPEFQRTSCEPYIKIDHHTKDAWTGFLVELFTGIDRLRREAATYKMNIDVVVENSNSYKKTFKLNYLCVRHMKKSEAASVAQDHRLALY